MTLFVQTVVAGVSTGAIYALVGLGYNVVYAGTGVFNLAQSQIFMLAAMFTWQFRQGFGWPTAGAVAAAVALSSAVNVVVERLAVAPLRRGRTYGAVPALGSLVTTLGAATVISNLALAGWGPQTKPFANFFPVSGLRVGGVVITRQQLLTVGTLVVVVAAYEAFSSRTRWGVALRALADDAEAAGMRGVPIGRGSMLSFGLAGAISALAGALTGHVIPGGVSPSLGLEVGLSGFAAIAIGGFGSAAGALAGGMVLGMADALTGSYWTDKYVLFVDLVLVLAVLAVRPRGLFYRASLREA
ncbi:MAG TPA: branched-chain amino acid ABC transporter permease [Acidimicrobiales bacterium]|nr:branched-chain amino acid ABC transporter permease [Acidimicrobiales bacterium]